MMHELTFANCSPWQLDLELSTLLDALSIQHQNAGLSEVSHATDGVLTSVMTGSAWRQPNAAYEPAQEHEPRDTHMIQDAQILAAESYQVRTPPRPFTTPSHAPTRRLSQSNTSDSSNSSDATPSSALVQVAHQATPTPTPADSSPAPPPPCALLQAIAHQFEQYATTSGEYLELIFTHREAFSSCPRGHEGCPAGFTALAHALERRAWRADRDADTEAVAAFRHEAWMTAAWLGSGGVWWGGSSS